MTSFLDKLDELFRQEGIDPENIPPAEEPDVRFHVWNPKIPGGAVYSCDQYEYVCSRCGCELVIGNTYDETEKADRQETFGEAMERLDIDPNCADEVVKGVHRR